MKKAKIDPNDPRTMELAFKTAELRKDLDAVLTKHGGRLQLGWQGKWAYLQVVFDKADTLALTLLKVRRDGKISYVFEAEEK